MCIRDRVNGAVFRDPAGQFTAVRAYLLEHHYPRDLRLKKIAAKCMAIAQTGQYNFDRCRKRRDWVTLRTVLARFQSETIALVFLLNRVFQPYYKWEFRRMTELPLLGERIGSGPVSYTHLDVYKRQLLCHHGLCR